MRYAAMFGERMERYGTKVYLINTGWTGGAYGEGKRINLPYTRAMVTAALTGEIELSDYRHHDIFNVLLQVMDEGRLTDGNGTTIDFRNTVIIMTSNSGTRQLKEFGQGIGFTRQGDANNREYARSIIQKTLQRQFSPEFLNRLDDIIFFDQLSKDSLHRIVDIEMRPLQKRLKTMGYDLQLTDAARDWLADRGYDVQFGARPLKRLLQTAVEDAFCQLILDGKVAEGCTVQVDADAATAKELTLKPL